MDPIEQLLEQQTDLWDELSRNRAPRSPPPPNYWPDPDPLPFPPSPPRSLPLPTLRLTDPDPPLRLPPRDALSGVASRSPPQFQPSPPPYEPHDSPPYRSSSLYQSPLLHYYRSHPFRSRRPSPPPSSPRLELLPRLRLPPSYSARRPLLQRPNTPPPPPRYSDHSSHCPMYGRHEPHRPYGHLEADPPPPHGAHQYQSHPSAPQLDQPRARPEHQSHGHLLFVLALFLGLAIFYGPRDTLALLGLTWLLLQVFDLLELNPTRLTVSLRRFQEYLGMQAELDEEEVE